MLKSVVYQSTKECSYAHIVQCFAKKQASEFYQH